MENLRQEIFDLKDKELTKKNLGEEYNLHFLEIQPDELTSADLDIYGKYRDGSLTKDEFENWRSGVIREIEKNGKINWKTDFVNLEKITDPRQRFVSWLGNQLESKEWLLKFGLNVHKDKFEKAA